MTASWTLTVACRSIWISRNFSIHYFSDRSSAALLNVTLLAKKNYVDCDEYHLISIFRRTIMNWSPLLPARE